MNNKSNFINKKRHWIDRLIIFCAFIGGFFLSTTVYSNRATNNDNFTLPKAYEETPRVVLEENLVRVDQATTKEVLQENIRKKGAVSEEPLHDPIDNQVLWGLDFSPNNQTVTIKIHAKENNRNLELPITISFLPDEQCEFGDGRACVYSLSASPGNQIILVSVHSGVGGEAEAFRNFLEGTGFSQGYYKLPQVIKNAQSLQGLAVEISQGGQMRTGLELISILRIPPEYLDAYMELPVEKILPFAVEITGIDPAIFNQALVIFETCGWQLPDEDPIEGHTVTSSSVYLGIIGLKDH